MFTVYNGMGFDLWSLSRYYIGRYVGTLQCIELAYGT